MRKDLHLFCGRRLHVLLRRPTLSRPTASWSCHFGSCHSVATLATTNTTTIHSNTITAPTTSSSSTSTTTTIAINSCPTFTRSQQERHWCNNAAVAVHLDDFSGPDDEDDEASLLANLQQDGIEGNRHGSTTTTTSKNNPDPKHCVTCTCPDDHHHDHHHHKQVILEQQQQQQHRSYHLHQFENPLIMYPPPTSFKDYGYQSKQVHETTPNHAQRHLTLEQSSDEGQQHQKEFNVKRQQQAEVEELQQQEQQQPEPTHHHDDDYPPPLPEPKVTFRRRVLPEHLVALSAQEGQQALMRAMLQNTAATYFMLTQHWDNQSDPASCGVTTLRQVLNAAGMDPTAVRWKGGWRYYGSDAMVVCKCMDPVRIQRAGITLPEFVRLAHCHGLEGRSERPDAWRNEGTGKSRINTVDDFRQDVLQSLRTRESSASMSESPVNPNDDATTRSNADETLPPTFLVVSFSRAVLQQTGDGHFSTVAAYDAQTDSCLVLDVARFKYPPYWVRVEELYDAMRPLDPVTKQSRGWSLWQRAGPWPAYLNAADGNVVDEGALPATWVPAFDQTSDATCPLRPIQVQYCTTAWDRRRQRQETPKET